MNTSHDFDEWQLTVVVLAAGKGKRMNNPDIPKVMAELDGIPLIGHVLGQVLQISPEQIIVVVGHHKEQVMDYVTGKFGKNIDFVVQEQQLGTGHAVRQAEPKLHSFSDDVLILSGDVPLLRAATMMSFVSEHRRYKPLVAASVLTMECDDPTGYGRIVRSDDGEFLRIVEEKDATPEEKAIKEVNSGIYVVSSHLLFVTLQELGNDNVQGEYYLTDIIGILHGKRFFTCNAIRTEDAFELQGINTPAELERAEILYRENYGR
jgi:UDP-N-acetylglucosamine diphosphorylase/glucosamine-1-phosphate N-acetyltransferase